MQQSPEPDSYVPNVVSTLAPVGPRPLRAPCTTNRAPQQPAALLGNSADGLAAATPLAHTRSTLKLAPNDSEGGAPRVALSALSQGRLCAPLQPRTTRPAVANRHGAVERGRMGSGPPSGGAGAHRGHTPAPTKLHRVARAPPLATSNASR